MKKFTVKKDLFIGEGNSYAYWGGEVEEVPADEWPPGWEVPVGQVYVRVVKLPQLRGNLSLSDLDPLED